MSHFRPPYADAACRTSTPGNVTNELCIDPDTGVLYRWDGVAWVALIGGSGENNVNADWNATSGDAEILNKPTIPAGSNDLANQSTVPGATVSDAINNAAQSGSGGSNAVDPLYGPLLSGVNFGTGSFTPGDRAGFTHGVQFNYPHSGHPETIPYMDLWRSKGARGCRIPFKWQDIQPDLNGPLNSTNVAFLVDAVNTALAHGFVVLLDMHDYGHRWVNGVDYEINVDPELTIAHLVDAWKKIAALFPTTVEINKRVWFELMNEPHQTVAEGWYDVMGAVIDAIRAQGNQNKLLVPTTNIQKMGSFVGDQTINSDSGAYLAMKAALADDSNLALCFHHYFDFGSGGGDASCMARGDYDIRPQIIEWLRTNNEEAYIGEMGFWGPEPRDPAHKDTGPTILYYAPWFFESMRENSDVLRGFFLWCTGFGWGDQARLAPAGHASTWNNPPELSYWVEHSIVPYLGNSRSSYATSLLDKELLKTEARQMDGTLVFHDFTTGLMSPRFHNRVLMSGGWETIEIKTDAARGESNGGSGKYGFRVGRPTVQSGFKQGTIQYLWGEALGLTKISVEVWARIESWTDPLNTDENRLIGVGEQGNHTNLASLYLAGNPARIVPSIYSPGQTGTAGTLVSGLVGSWHKYRLEVDMTAGARHVKAFIDDIEVDSVSDTGTQKIITSCEVGVRSKTQLVVAYDSVNIIRY